MQKSSKSKNKIIASKSLLRTETVEKSETLYFDIMGVKAKMVIPQSSSDTVVSNYKKIFPSAKIQERIKPDIMVEVIKSPKGFIKVKGNTVLIGSSSNPEQLAMEGILAVSKFSERRLNEQEIFSIHASGICNDYGCVLLLGSSGSGKTTTAANSCIINNFSFIDNRVLIKDHSVIGATDLFSIRLGSLTSEFCKYIDPKYVSSSESSDPQDKKIKLESEFLQINRNKKYPLKIKAIVFVKKIPVDLSVTEIHEADKLLPQLYESLSRYSDVFPSFVLGAKVPYPNIFGQKLKQRRINFACNLLDNVQSFVAEGNLDQLSNFTSKLLLSKI